MFGYFIILFTVLPALELVVLIKVGAVIGAFNTLFIIIATGVMGAYLARYQGFLIINKIQHNLNQGHMPSDELLEGLMILVGGIVLLTPGFITDVLGFLMLIPFTRILIKSLVEKRFQQAIEKGQIRTYSKGRSDSRNGYDDIDIN